MAFALLLSGIMASLAAVAQVDNDVRGVLRDSFIELNSDWKFRSDPSFEGDGFRWHLSNWQERTFQTLSATRSWEEQVDQVGLIQGWYQREIRIPEHWRNEVVGLFINGIGDSFDLFLNGTFISSRGDYPSESVGNRTAWIPIHNQCGADQSAVLTLRVKSWGNGSGLIRNLGLSRRIKFEFIRSKLPRPMLPEHKDWEELYWKAWQIAWQRISSGTAENGFSEFYMNEGFNPEIFQWDSIFMSLFARYGMHAFPAMSSLDNFYRSQRSSGYIQRVYRESNGQEPLKSTAENREINPPLFAWAEWEYLVFSGDRSRLGQVYPKLRKYYQWLKKNAESPRLPGLYYQSAWGSGMDNIHRGNIDQGAWSDMCFQMALFAKKMAELAEFIEPKEVAYWKTEWRKIRDSIQQNLWNASERYYFDQAPNGALSRVKHIGAYWSLLSDVADAGQANALVHTLFDSQHFFRPHLFPSISAQEPTYSRTGKYWLGAVWAPTNYMVIKGLEHRQRFAQARTAAENHIQNISRVYKSKYTGDRLAPEDRNRNRRTIWECYSPELPEPCSRADGVYFGKPDFVGWSGLGPIALLIETVLGINVDALHGKVFWRPRVREKHGVQHLPYGLDGFVDLMFEPLNQMGWSIRGSSTRNFKLILLDLKKAEKEYSVGPGAFSISSAQ